MHFVVKFLIDVVDLNVINAQYGTTLLSSRLFQSDNCCFLVEKKIKLTPNMTKIPDFFFKFQRFYAFFKDF